MKKYILFTWILIGCYFNSFCQIDGGRSTDSLRITNIKKALPKLNGPARVDSFLRLCEYYNYGYPKNGDFQFWIDSIHLFAKIAFTEATSLGYKRGIALSVLVRKDVDLLDEEKIQDAIRIGIEINDEIVLGWGYFTLADFTNGFPQYVEVCMKAIYHFRNNRDSLKEAEVNIKMMQAFSNHGELEYALDFGKRAFDLLHAKTKIYDFVSSHYLLMQRLYSQMADMYSTAGDYETAIKYLRANEQYGKLHNTNYQDFSFNKAEVFCKMGQADSSLYYADTTGYRHPSVTVNEGEKAWGISVLGQACILNKQYDNALTLFSYSIANFKKINYPFGTVIPLLFSSQVYIEKKDYFKALTFANEGLALAKRWNLRPQLMHGYQLLSSIYHHLGNNDSAYTYLLKHTTIKDSILNKQGLFKLYNFQKEAENAKKESQIGFLNRDNMIKQQQLKQEATFRNFLIVAFISVVFAGLFVYRNITMKRKNDRLKQEQKEQEWKLKQLENENRQTELQKQAVELEMQALRAQMSPHFIFNCLSSINRFILKNEAKTASNYLTRFSRLIRMVLINSQKSMITLEEELEMLRIYLDMERLRFKDSFDFIISFKNVIDTETVLIPPLMLQPICENALWHGLMHKEGQGHLAIELSMEDYVLQCMITDDGIGREKAAELKSKSAEREKSFGLQITTERLALLNREKGLYADYEIRDLKDEMENAAGTKVTLRISYKESVEQPT